MRPAAASPAQSCRHPARSTRRLAPHRADALLARRQADVALKQRGRAPGGVEAAAVVAHLQLNPLRVGRDGHVDVRGAAVLDGVREQLAREEDDQLVVPPAGVRVDRDGDLGPQPTGAAVGERAERRRQPGMVEDIWVELEDFPAQLRHRLVDRAARTLERRVAARAVVIDELLPSDRERLHRLVVQQLGQPAPLALLGGQRVRGELAALLREAGDRRVALAEHLGDERGGQADQREVGDLARDARRRLDLAGGGWTSDSRMKADDRPRRPAGGERGAKARRGQDGQHEERHRGLGERAAGGVRQRDDRRQVDERLGTVQRARDSRPPPGPPRGREHARRPQREGGEQVREGGGVGARMVDELLAQQHDRHERRPQRRHPQTADPRRGHSSSPRRMASATAAARSETPSFS